MQIPTTGTLKVSSARHLSPKILKWMTHLRAEMPGRRLFRVPVVGICICEALFKKNYFVFLNTALVWYGMVWKLDIARHIHVQQNCSTRPHWRAGNERKIQNVF